MSPLEEIEKIQKSNPSLLSEPFTSKDCYKFRDAVKKYKLLSKEFIPMNDLKTYLTDASNNLKLIIPNAVFLRFDENGNVLLEGKFGVMDLQAIVERQTEVRARLAEMRKENTEEKAE